MIAVLEKSNELPDGWKELAIEDIAEVNPRVNKSEIPDDLAVSFVPMPAVETESGAIDVSQERPFSEVKKGFTPFKEGDVLFAKITPCMENGKMAVVPKLKNGYGFGSTEFHVLRPKEGIESKYIYYFVSSRTFRGVAQHNMSGAVGQKRVPTNYLKQHLIPVAPPEQQKRIVAKIEELFSHIDAGIEALKKAKQLLKQYRQSVLKAAVTGELTKEWREANKAKLELASQLLERILKERRQKWEEQQLEQFKAKGKMPKDDGWKKKYKENGPLGAIDSSDLPGEWLWVKTEQIGDIQLGRQRAPKYHSGLNMRPYLRVQNVFEDRIDLDDVMEMEFSASDYEKYKLKHNDILLNEGQSPELLGRPAIYRDELPGACFTNTLIRFQAVSGILPQYALLVFRYFMHSGRFKNAGTITTNIGHLSAGRFSQIEFPLCGTSEQEEVVKITNEKCISINRLENEIDHQVIKSEKNKQSVLASAFSGSLA